MAKLMDQMVDQDRQGINIHSSKCLLLNKHLDEFVHYKDYQQLSCQRMW